MCAFKLMVVEDKDEEIATCRDTVARYSDEKKRDVELVECKTIEDFRAKLNNSIDGAIIDLRLADQGDEGNQVILEIEKTHFRIPVAVLTGTPDAVDHALTYIGVFKKGDPGTGYDDLLDRFWRIHNTGLTRIMGGRGIIEETLNKVFQQNLLPEEYRNKWEEYGQNDSPRTEKALLRHALNHLLQLLDDDGESCFPEEFYLSPPLTTGIKTGSIVNKKNKAQKLVVMNPACDLVIRNNGQCNTDRILIIEIDPQISLFPDYPLTGLTKEQKKNLEKAFKNNKSTYYHWLPKTDFFEGGFLNFRKVSTMAIKEFKEEFETPAVQISPFFVKDIVARFSTYYSRQGQPDIDFKHFINL
nr:response regulator [Desulfobacula sp.]